MNQGTINTGAVFLTTFKSVEVSTGGEITPVY
jgi:hypothetical protein